MTHEKKYAAPVHGHRLYIILFIFPGRRGVQTRVAGVIERGSFRIAPPFRRELEEEKKKKKARVGETVAGVVQEILVFDGPRIGGGC